MNMLIDSNTKLYGLFGNPVKHSKSPVMLNAAFQSVGINAAYIAFQIPSGKLKEAINGIRAMGFRGINVTIPYKEEVIYYLDDIDINARRIGAVNTIVNDNGKLIGYNTDGIGYARSLKEECGFTIRGKKLLILGAGGAAKGLVHALANEEPDTIWIANRTKERAVELAQAIKPITNAIGIGLNEIELIKKELNFIVNTMPVGQFPNENEVPIETHWFHESLTVSDIIYNPEITKFLAEAKAKGSRIHSGLGMLIYQGAYAFEYWTGLTAPIPVMRKVFEQSK
ncbi:shikimate dehydrogenase [Paenibacillus tarimensis]